MAPINLPMQGCDKHLIYKRGQNLKYSKAKHNKMRYAYKFKCACKFYLILQFTHSHLTFV